MYIIKCKITGKNANGEEFFELLDNYLHDLYRCKQIVNKEWYYEPIENGISLHLLCLEKKSYALRHSSEYAKSGRKRIEDEFNCRFDFIEQGIDRRFHRNRPLKKFDTFILRAFDDSPLLDAKSLDSIPLYKIPYTYHDGKCYDDIYFWQKNYKQVDGLWLNGAVSEKWCQNQLQNPNSDLNKQGMDCRRRVEELTNVPTYYYLFNYRAIGKVKDKKRKCPLCGGDWLREKTSLHTSFAFQCDTCRLISELTPNR